MNTFEGNPDARQSTEISQEVSRFRPTYRALSANEKALHDEIKAKAVEMEQLFNKVGTGRYASLAMTNLEESVMWIVKQLTSNPSTEGAPEKTEHSEEPTSAETGEHPAQFATQAA